MSSSSRSNADDSIFDVEELLHIEARCRELRREKDLLKETQSQSFDLIKRLELHVRRLNEARLEDRKHNLELQKELDNCHQEIDYLQDQLKTRNEYVDSLEERVDHIEMKLTDIGLLEQEIVTLREDLNKSSSECEFLMQELQTKETELHNSFLYIEKLEESITSAALEYQCEIESMRLEIMALEQKCFESTKSYDDSRKGKGGLNESFHDLKLKLVDAQRKIKNLENENKQAMDRLHAFEKEAEFFCQSVEEHFSKHLKSREHGNPLASAGGNESKGLAAATEVSSCGVILGPLLSKLLTIGISDADVKGDTKTMLHQLQEYEELVKQLKEELKQDKFRAKDEAEDLAQEMAELRYQLTELLEQERKHRACIEQASLQRISELESQLQIEKGKSFASVRGIC